MREIKERHDGQRIRIKNAACTKKGNKEMRCECQYELIEMDAARFGVVVCTMRSRRRGSRMSEALIGKRLLNEIYASFR